MDHNLILVSSDELNISFGDWRRGVAVMAPRRKLSSRLAVLNAEREA